MHTACMSKLLLPFARADHLVCVCVCVDDYHLNVLVHHYAHSPPHCCRCITDVTCVARAPVCSMLRRLLLVALRKMLCVCVTCSQRIERRSNENYVLLSISNCICFLETSLTMPTNHSTHCSWQFHSHLSLSLSLSPARTFLYVFARPCRLVCPAAARLDVWSRLHRSPPPLHNLITWLCCVSTMVSFDEITSCCVVCMCTIDRLFQLCLCLPDDNSNLVHSLALTPFVCSK